MSYIKDHGLENDTYAGAWHKQLSFFPQRELTTLIAVS